MRCARGILYMYIYVHAFEVSFKLNIKITKTDTNTPLSERYYRNIKEKSFQKKKKKSR